MVGPLDALEVVEVPVLEVEVKLVALVVEELVVVVAELETVDVDTLDATDELLDVDNMLLEVELPGPVGVLETDDEVDVLEVDVDAREEDELESEGELL
ncbi:MAG: hypothetical protein Q9208_004237 [Pyrenodesmia sp. 3 TL-2023]